MSQRVAGEAMLAIGRAVRSRKPSASAGHNRAAPEACLVMATSITPTAGAQRMAALALATRSPQSFLSGNDSRHAKFSVAREFSRSRWAFSVVDAMMIHLWGSRPRNGAPRNGVVGQLRCGRTSPRWDADFERGRVCTRQGRVTLRSPSMIERNAASSAWALDNSGTLAGPASTDWGLGREVMRCRSRT